MEQESADFIGTYDHGLDSAGSLVPPVQGGFLLFKPSEKDFNEIVEVTREGDFTGSGWKGSGIGYCYGGVGPTGLLSYHFHKDAIPTLRGSSKTSLIQELEGLNSSTTSRARSGMKAHHSKKMPRMLAVDRKIYDVLLSD